MIRLCIAILITSAIEFFWTSIHSKDFESFVQALGVLAGMGDSCLFEMTLFGLSALHFVLLILVNFLHLDFLHPDAKRQAA